jgi:23S rRNA (guanosine2251-2'-O)-methyltransferase
MARQGRHEEAHDVVAGRRPVVELLRAGKPAEAVLLAEGIDSSSTVGEIRKRAKGLAIPVKVVPRQKIDALAGGLNHQGVVATGAVYRYVDLDSLLNDESDPVVLFLDGVTDPQNLGSLLRTVDGAGMTGVVLPTRRSVGVTAAVRRASAGASERVPVARTGNLSQALDHAREAGLWTVAVTGDAAETLWESDILEPPLGLVLGAEGRGISQKVKQHCDGAVAIPLAGEIGSLNVAIAGAIVMFELARRRAAGGISGA